MNISKPTIPMQTDGGYFYPLTSGDQVMVDDKNKLLNNAKLNIDLIYPIGSIYMSMSDTDPSILFGGTWEMPKHDHNLRLGVSGYSGWEGRTTGDYYSVSIPNTYVYGPYSALHRTYATNFLGFAAPTGGDQPHNNMPPYLVVNMWQRIR